MLSGSGIVAYARKRSGVAVAALAGAAALGGAAHAEEAGAVVAVAEVAGVDVHGKGPTLDEQTNLAAMPTTIQDAPQAISVIDSAKLKAQGVSTLEQALRNVPGITVAIGEGGTLNGDQFKIRGFDSKDDVYVDGLRDFGVYTRDSFNYEEVQVLKGPSGALFGRGSTGGAINTISKRPKLDHFASFDAYAGQGDYYRGLVDLNHKVGETSAVRLNLMRSDTGVKDRDLVKSDRWGVALSGGIGLGTDTSVVLSYLHQDDRRRPDYGILLVQRPGELIARPASEYGVGVERSSFLGMRNDVDRTKADIFTVQFAHKFSDSVSLTSDTRLGFYSRYFQYSNLDQCNAGCTAALFDNNPATEAFGGMGGGGPYDMDATGVQNITALRWEGDLGGVRHQSILGIDISKQVNDKIFYAYTLPTTPTLVATRPNIPRPIVNPDPNLPAGYSVFRAVPGQNIDCSGAGNCRLPGGGAFTNVTGTTIYSSRGVSTDLAAFLTERVWFTDQLSVIGSFRLDRYIAELRSVTYAGAGSTIKAESTLKSPRLSLLWEPADDQSFYVSWGRAQTPQGTSIVGSGTALTVAAKDLEPEETEMWELGAKVGVPHTRLSATASVFKIKKSNALQLDPATGFLAAQSGERQEVKGVELGLRGLLADNWTIDVAYAYLDAKIKESFSNCSVPTSTTGTPTNIVCPVGVTAAIPVLNPVAVGRQVAFVPKHSASFYTTYHLDDWIPGLSIGGDVVYQGKLNLTYTARSLSFAARDALVPARLGVAPESVTVDAFAVYKTGPYRFAVNVYNLTDRLNYTQVFSNRAVPAAGRTFIFSVGATF